MFSTSSRFILVSACRNNNKLFLHTDAPIFCCMDLSDWDIRILSTYGLAIFMLESELFPSTKIISQVLFFRNFCNGNNVFKINLDSFFVGIIIDNIFYNKLPPQLLPDPAVQP